MHIPALVLEERCLQPRCDRAWCEPCADHRARVSGRSVLTVGFKDCVARQILVDGFEAVHVIAKGQMKYPREYHSCAAKRFSSSIS